MLARRYPRKLIRAVTYDSVAPQNIARKRLLSEHNDSLPETIPIKRVLKGTALHESNLSDVNSHNPVAQSFFVPDVNVRSSILNDTFIHSMKKEDLFLPELRRNLFKTSENMFLLQEKPRLSDIHEYSQGQNTSEQQQITFITAVELSTCLNSQQETVNGRLLIIDCGLPFRYNERRIKSSLLLNINDKLSRKRLMSRGLEKFLDGQHLERLDQSEIIILYDDLIRYPLNRCHFASSDQFQLSPSMKCLHDHIKRYDSKKILFVLRCTFDEFHQQCPDDCEIIRNDEIIENDNVSGSTPLIDIDSFVMCEVVPGLYLGNANDAKDKTLLEQNQIKSIINVSTHIPCHYQHENSFEYLRVQCEDSINENLFPHLEQTLEFIQQNLTQNQNVLIHCHAGISRSPSFVIAYLMKFYSKTFEQALLLVKNRRTIVCPNLNFLAQLKTYEQQLSSTSHN